MQKINLYLIVVILFFIKGSSLSAQGISLFDDSKHRIGFITGFGGENLSQLLDDINEKDAMKLRNYLTSIGINPNKEGLNVKYDYQVQFFQLQYYWSFLSKETWGLDLLAQPQYNLTRYRHVDNIPDEVKGYEIGINLGVLIRKNFFKNILSLYGFISSGPHYVSGTPQRQSSGFIFSDNFFVGMNIKLFKNTYLDLRPGFRHISNAGLTHPNRGVNDLIISGGILVNL